MPLLAELFRGTGSVGKVAARKGWRVFSVDIDPASGATYTGDIRDFPYARAPVPDFVWASPPCTTYSFAANWAHKRNSGAMSAAAKDADDILRHTLRIIRYWAKRNPKLKVCIENPRGHMRSMPEMKPFLRTTTYYSQYGWPIHKPTDFFTNFPLRLRPAEAPAGVETVAVGKGPGWRAAIRDAFGPSAAGQSQATLLGRIPPTLVRDILRQMEEAKKAV